MQENPVSENPYEIAQRQFDNAAKYLDLKEGIKAKLRLPKRELSVNFPVEKGDISISIAKDVFTEMFETGRLALQIVEEKGLA